MAAAVAGNALEFYDFTAYAFFAAQIGHSFFPSHSGYFSLLLSLGTFGIGFISRPLGAWVIGRYGDRAGRRPAMMLSFSLMCAGVLGMALTPSYAQLGLAAPLLVVLFRLVQGFALGGEVGPTTAFLIEACPPSQRGYYGAWQYASQGIAILAAGSVGLALIDIMPPAALTDYGWRIPFLLGAAILPLGFYLRHGLPETLTPQYHAATPSTAQATDYRRTAKLGVAMLCSTTVCFAIFNYMTTYATQVLHMAQGPAFGATIAAGLANLIFNLAGGAASDRWGRKSLMLYPRITLLLLTIPGFAWIIQTRSPTILITVTATLAALASLSNSPCLVCLTEAIPRRARAGTLSILYALAIAAFHGTAQLLVTWLIDKTGNPMCPAYYMSAATLAGLLPITLLGNIAPARARA